MVAAQAHLVSPIDRGPLAFGVSGQRRILLNQPALDRAVVSLIGPSHRLLRRHPPSPEVAPHRRQRYRHPVLALDQSCHTRPRPQIERQLQLIGILITIRPRLRADCAQVSRPDPGRRPRRLNFSARRPPTLARPTHLFTARRLTANRFAAAPCFRQPRTALTTNQRTWPCVAISSFRPSVFASMPWMITYYALLYELISNAMIVALQADQSNELS